MANLNTKHLYITHKIFCIPFISTKYINLFIKEGKLGLSFDKISNTDFIANANKLREMVLAYNFNNWFRNLCLNKTYMKDMTIETIRTKANTWYDW
jgi:hypothetical protein